VIDGQLVMDINMFGSCYKTDKKLLDGDWQNFPEGLRKVEPAFGDDDQKVGTDRRPNLDVCAVEREVL